MSSYTLCHTCGQEGHYARQCTAPAPAIAGPALKGTPSPPPVPPRRPESEIADAEAWAGRVRQHFGWDAMSGEHRRRELARRQVAESRRDRYAEVF